MRLLGLPFSAWPETERGVKVWQLTGRKRLLAKGSQLGGDVTPVTTSEAKQKPGK